MTPDHRSSRRSFDAYLEQAKARMTEEERAEYEAWREHFRRVADGEDPTAVREPA